MSLRDVERVLKVMSWFYQQSQGNMTLFNLMDEKLGNEQGSIENEEESEVLLKVCSIDKTDRNKDVLRRNK